MKNIMVHLVLFTLLTGCSGIEWFPSTSVITITPVTLPAPTVGVVYSQTLTASGGTSPYTWAISSGTLPTGLALDLSTGIVSGTPTATGTFTFTVKVTDSKSLTATQTYTLVSSQITIVPTALPIITVDGSEFSLTMDASGGTAPYTWSVPSGTLPGWLTLDPTTGTFTGTPTAAGSTTFTVMVTDSKSLSASQTYTLTTVLPLAITHRTYSSAVLLNPYKITVNATGGLKPYVWTVSSVPPLSGSGLVFNQISSSAVISGTPAVAGDYNVTVTVTDFLNNIDQWGILISPR